MVVKEGSGGGASAQSHAPTNAPLDRLPAAGKPALRERKADLAGQHQPQANRNRILTADRITHLKIVAVSLICATVVAGIGRAARATDGTTAGSRAEVSVIKASAPVMAASNAITIR
jgi:hypothetical protein